MQMPRVTSESFIMRKAMFTEVDRSQDEERCKGELVAKGE